MGGAVGRLSDPLLYAGRTGPGILRIFNLSGQTAPKDAKQMSVLPNDFVSKYSSKGFPAPAVIGMSLR